LFLIVYECFFKEQYAFKKRVVRDTKKKGNERIFVLLKSSRSTNKRTDFNKLVFFAVHRKQTGNKRLVKKGKE